MLTTAHHIRWGMTALKRALEVFVVWPSAMIGFMIFVSGFAGNSPIRDMVGATYEWGDTLFRNAPEGKVLVIDSSSFVISDESIGKPFSALHTKLKSVPIQQSIDDTTETLTRIYWVCVMLGSLLMMLVLGPKKFIGVPVLHSSAKQDGKTR